jgi:hypothetical protein
VPTLTVTQIAIVHAIKRSVRLKRVAAIIAFRELFDGAMRPAR